MRRSVQTNEIRKGTQLVQRREHNRFARIYDPDFAMRPGAFDGVACATCGLPVLVHGDRDPRGRWFHLDCTVPPAEEDVATYLLLHDAAELGLAYEEICAQVDEAALGARVAAYRDCWLLAVERVRKQRKLRRKELRR